MKRIAAVLAALAVTGCGGSTTDPVVQTYRYQINICESDGACTQLGRCIDLLSGFQTGPARVGATCRQVAGHPAPFWVWDAADGLCAPADCREVDVTPPAPTCQAVIECSRPF